MRIDADMTLKHQEFDSYETYVAVQKAKGIRFRKRLLAGYKDQVMSFKSIFEWAKPYLALGPVLCLGARTGAEVEAFEKLGYAGSIGVDLYPLGENVIEADWEALPFNDFSFANVYTNSLDHCRDLHLLITEIRRILSPLGIMFFMATNRIAFKDLESRITGGGNEALFWQHSDDLRDAFAEAGFTLVTSWTYGKWGAYVMRKA